MGFLPGIVPRHSSTMNTATPFPWSDSPAGENPGTTFRAAFEHAPIAVALCNPQGLIVEMNPAFERTLDRGVATRRRLRLGDLVRPQDRDKTELLLRDLLVPGVTASASKPGAMGRPARSGPRGASPVPQESPTTRCSWRSRAAARFPRRKVCFKLRDGRRSDD